ncbi:MAG TPA: DUF932 domain-containing protein [Bryobacteraceae bacterium]|nr:DUF932 domain-containing protein [Bryobacteraceae bacterium]
MAHRIYVEDGKAAMMYVGQDPWHGLGTKLEHPATAAEAIKAAHLDWTVKKVPLYAWGDGVAYPIDDKFTVVPAHLWGQEKCPTFGVVGRDYTPMQNNEAFEFFDPIVGEGAAIYHTAGALDEGRRIWLLAKLPTDIKVADGDITHKYLLLTNSHDASSSVQIKFTPTRVVCHNTLTMALQEGERALRVPHTRDIKERLEGVRRNLHLINTEYEEIERVIKGMAKDMLDAGRLAKYLKLVFPDPPSSKPRREFIRMEEQAAGHSRIHQRTGQRSARSGWEPLGRLQRHHPDDRPRPKQAHTGTTSRVHLV